MFNYAFYRFDFSFFKINGVYLFLCYINTPSLMDRFTAEFALKYAINFIL